MPNVRILYSDPTIEVTDPKIMVLWGGGLIGQAIFNELTRYDKLDLEDYPFPWKNNTAQMQSALMISQVIEKRFLAASDKFGGPRLVFVWSAGQAGFSATLDDTRHEMIAFTIVLELAKKLQQQLVDVCVEFHLVSSAGGLFEGRKYIDDGDLPKPRRPYGQLKWDQEQDLLKATEIIPYIYRAASVYGIPCHGRRSSLVSVLLHHGILRQVATIVGTPTTLRDYVYVDDVAKYIATKIVCSDSTNTEGGLFWMVSGKPSSIIEISGMVEDIIRRRLYLSYKFDPENCGDITFAPHIRPTDFDPIMPRIGITLVHRYWQEFI